MASWFPSNCNNAQSRRSELVAKLQTYFEVDIYGKCGTLTCHRFNKKCNNLGNYWFHFSFEDSLCPDYLTEKVYKKMNQNVLLVVFNGAELNKFLPPHSVIDANSFATADDLANYLIYLTKNPLEYVKYFWWKKFYYTQSSARLNYYKICSAINKSSLKNTRESYTNMTAWFFEGCSEPKIKF